MPASARRLPIRRAWHDAEHGDGTRHSQRTRNESAVRLEDQLHRKLQLACRPRISGRKASAPDHAKATAADLSREAGITKVGMVEQIKCFKSEFMTDPLRDLRHLADGEVEVLETWPDHRVSSHFPEVHSSGGGQCKLRPGRTCDGGITD